MIQTDATQSKRIYFDTDIFIYNPTIISIEIRNIFVGITTPDKTKTLNVSDAQTTVDMGAAAACNLESAYFKGGRWTRHTFGCQVAVSELTADMVSSLASTNRVEIGLVTVTDVYSWWPRWLPPPPGRYTADFHIMLEPPQPAGVDAKSEKPALKAPFVLIRPLSALLLWLVGGDQRGGLGIPISPDVLYRAEQCQGFDEVDAMLDLPGLRVKPANYDASEAIIQYARQSIDCFVPLLPVMEEVGSFAGKHVGSGLGHLYQQLYSLPFPAPLMPPSPPPPLVPPVRPPSAPPPPPSEPFFSPGFPIESPTQFVDLQGSRYPTSLKTGKKENRFNFHFNSLMLSLVPSSCTSTGILRSEISVAFALNIFNPSQFDIQVMRESSASVRDARGNLIGRGRVLKDEGMPPRETSTARIIIDFRYLVARLGLDFRIDQPEANYFHSPIYLLKQELEGQNLTIDADVTIRVLGQRIRIQAPKVATFRIDSATV